MKNKLAQWHTARLVLSGYMVRFPDGPVTQKAYL
jgi:hypothetical protein